MPKSMGGIGLVMELTYDFLTQCTLLMPSTARCQLRAHAVHQWYTLNPQMCGHLASMVLAHNPAGVGPVKLIKTRKPNSC